MREVHKPYPVGRRKVILVPDGNKTDSEHDLLSVSHVIGSDVVKMRSNCRDSSFNVNGIEALEHIHQAIGRMLELMKAAAGTS
jgi:hypothetical protein